MAPEATGGAQRLHVMSLPLRLLVHARNLLVPGLIVLLFTHEGRWEIWLMAMFVPSMIIETLRYISLRYWLREDEIVIREGLIFRRERHIPYARIQNIDLVQRLLYRPLGVAEVRLQTGSGQETEASLAVLSLKSVDTMRQRVFAERRRAEGPAGAPPSGEAAEAGRESATSPELLVSLPASELVKLGLVANRSMALVVVVLGLAWEFELLAFTGFGWRDWAAPVMALFGFAAIAALALMITLVIVVLLQLFSVIWTIVRFHGFRLERSGDDLRLSCGLLTWRSATIPRRRVQFVSVRASPAHRLFDRVSISVETAGGAGTSDQEETTASRKWFVPILPRDQLPRLLEALDVRLDFEQGPWRPLAPMARRRMLFKSTVVALVCCIPFVAIFGRWGLVSPAILLPLAWWYAVKAVKYMSYAKTAEGLMFRSGVWTRRMSGTFFDKIQVIQRKESPFDRRYRMASMSVDTAGAGAADHRISVPYLEAEVAEALVEELYALTERSTFRWA